MPVSEGVGDSVVMTGSGKRGEVNVMGLVDQKFLVILSEMSVCSGNGFGIMFAYQSQSEAWPCWEMASVDVGGPGGNHWAEGLTMKVSYKVLFGVHFVDILMQGEDREMSYFRLVAKK